MSAIDSRLQKQILLKQRLGFCLLLLGIRIFKSTMGKDIDKSYHRLIPYVVCTPRLSNSDRSDVMLFVSSWPQRKTQYRMLPGEVIAAVHILHAG